MPETTPIEIQLVNDTSSLFQTATGGNIISAESFFITLFGSLFIGIIIALCYAYRNRCTRGFLSTLVIIPPAVSSIIMIVSHDLGTGIAVAGTFSLVRFRSLPAGARELGMLFLAMGAGLSAGMGQLMYAIIFTVILCAVYLVGNHAFIGSTRQNINRIMNVTIPEDLDYTGVFDDLMQAYTTSHELVKVKTTNMGSLFRLTYKITLRDANLEKSLIDSIRVRNGNLEITVSNQETTGSEL